MMARDLALLPLGTRCTFSDGTAEPMRRRQLVRWARLNGSGELAALVQPGRTAGAIIIRREGGALQRFPLDDEQPSFEAHNGTERLTFVQPAAITYTVAGSDARLTFHT